MADTNTTVLDLLLMEIDSHENDWGDQTNANLTLISRAIGATVAHAVTTGTVTLTRDNVKDALHRITGVLVGNVVIEVPATEPKTYDWKNETTGAFTVTVKVTGQTGVVIAQGETKRLRCNGTDVVDVGLEFYKYATAVGGTADAITISTSPVFSTYNTSMRFRFVATGANTVTNPTINVDGLGVKTIKKLNNQALNIAEIAGAGHICECGYDGTSVILLNGASAGSIGKQTIFIPASAIISRATAGAGLITLESTTNKVNRKGLAFDPSTIEYGQFQVAMPKGWDASTVTARFIWEHPTASTNFAVVWGIQSMALADGDSLDTAFGTAVTVTDTGGSTPTHYKSPETGAITIGNTPAKGETAFFQIYRDATAGGDTLAVDAYLIGIELYYTTDAATDA
jgi:hypothetical protein